MAMRLFKYLDEAGIDLLENRRFLIKPAVELNDPFEMQAASALSISEEKLKHELRFKNVQDKLYDGLVRLGKYKGPRHNFYAWMKKDLQSHIRGLKKSYDQTAFNAWKLTCELQAKSTGVISLTRRPNCMLMWSHYTNGHKGFLIEFDLEKRPFSDYRRFSEALIPITYSTKLVEIPASISEFSIEQIDAYKRMLSTKFEEWRYEKEYRILHSIAKIEKESGRRGSPYYIEIDPRSIKQIVLGARSTEKFAERMKIILNVDHYRDVILKKSFPHPTHYKVCYRPENR